MISFLMSKASFDWDTAIGAGYWRKGKRIYETENQIHK
jgi:hypothetical protein